MPYFDQISFNCYNNVIYIETYIIVTMIVNNTRGRIFVLYILSGFFKHKYMICIKLKLKAIEFYQIVSRTVTPVGPDICDLI